MNKNNFEPAAVTAERLGVTVRAAMLISVMGMAVLLMGKRRKA